MAPSSCSTSVFENSILKSLSHGWTFPMTDVTAGSIRLQRMTKKSILKEMLKAAVRQLYNSQNWKYNSPFRVPANIPCRRSLSPKVTWLKTLHVLHVSFQEKYFAATRTTWPNNLTKWREGGPSNSWTGRSYGELTYWRLPFADSQSVCDPCRILERQ